MATGQIRLTPSELRSDAVTYGNCGSDIEEILRKLQQLQEKLRGDWEGAAFERFDDQFQELSPKVVMFADLMHDIKKQLEDTAHDLEEFDQKLSGRFGFK